MKCVQVVLKILILTVLRLNTRVLLPKTNKDLLLFVPILSYTLVAHYSDSLLFLDSFVKFLCPPLEYKSPVVAEPVSVFFIAISLAHSRCPVDIC